MKDFRFFLYFVEILAVFGRSFFFLSVLLLFCLRNSPVCFFALPFLNRDIKKKSFNFFVRLFLTEAFFNAFIFENYEVFFVPYVESLTF